MPNIPDYIKQQFIKYKYEIAKREAKRVLRHYNKLILVPTWRTKKNLQDLYELIEEQNKKELYPESFKDKFNELLDKVKFYQRELRKPGRKAKQNFVDIIKKLDRDTQISEQQQLAYYDQQRGLKQETTMVYFKKRYPDEKWYQGKISRLISAHLKTL